MAGAVDVSESSATAPTRVEDVMFDLIAGGPRRPFHESTVAPTVASVFGHGLVLLALAGASFLATSDQLPDVPDMMAFVADAPAPPPPPARRATPARPRPLPLSSQSAAPIEALSAIAPEAIVPANQEIEGVEGGVEGGIAGGVSVGVIGGLLEMPAPLPLPPEVPVRRTPVRIRGQIIAPALVHRVSPQYPELAMLAKVTGVVILEATIDVHGGVEAVLVVRSLPLLDKAAIEAVKQWRYSPLVLNGTLEPFVLTVTLVFSLTDTKTTLGL
jgi:protein TonB